VEGTEIDLQLTNQLYRTSRRITQASTAPEIFANVSNAIQQSSYFSGLYLRAQNSFDLVESSIENLFYANDIPKTLSISGPEAETYLQENSTLIIEDVNQPDSTIHSELLYMPQQLNCISAAILPIYQNQRFVGLIILGSRDKGGVTNTGIQPFVNLIELMTTALEKITALHETKVSLKELRTLNNFGQAIGNERDLKQLYRLIHKEIRSLFGELEFYVALYDKESDHLEIPYIYEKGQILNVDPFPLGEGLTSIVVRSKQPLMLVEDTEEKSRELGAKVEGNFAKSWMGVPLIASGEVIGVMTVQDIELEHRFDENDLRIMTTLSSQIAGVIYNANLLIESEKRALELQTAAEIARDTSGTLETSELLEKAINLVRDRFDFYHASVFLLDSTKEFAVVRESTGEAGKQMIADGHSLEVGSQSVIGYVTANAKPLVVDDVTLDPTHRFNPLLPDTRAELGIPLIVGDRVLGALDVQSTTPFAFSKDNINVLQILADQLAVAVANADLFTETQEHLAQHRLIHHITTVAASSTNLDEALLSTVQGLRVTLGDRISILIVDLQKDVLRVSASAGYDEDILGMQIKFGEGITGWVAENKEPLLVNNVLNDPRYISGNDTVRSELAIPLNYRGEILGVLNVESDNQNAFDEHDQDILGTLGGSLSAIIVNTKLAERQRQLFDVTNKIRRSVSMENILETTANELSNALQARKAQIRVGGESAVSEVETNGNGGNQIRLENGEETIE
ncbi:MAG: GAF domain-containing protein, partial [Chloroflexota bacterium]